MARADYAHWNEEADLVWWQEEGRHEKPDTGMTKDDYLDYYSRFDSMDDVPDEGD
jgi:hypothetical protein